MKLPDIKDIVEANDILHTYTLPNSGVDIGNVYFAAHVFKDAFEAIEAKLQEAQAELNKFKKKLAESEEIRNTQAAMLLDLELVPMPERDALQEENKAFREHLEWYAKQPIGRNAKEVLERYPSREQKPE